MGVKGSLHPSLQAYIDSFLSNPFPKQWPRGGGVWDQDPILVRDFRIILRFEREWKDAQEKMKEGPDGSGGGGGLGIESALNEYMESLGEEGMF